MSTTLLVAAAILVLNLPFGYWRAGVRKFSPQWFVAVHAPVPLAIGLRLASGLGLHLATLPLFVAAFFGGQFLGGSVRNRHSRGHQSPNPVRGGATNPP